MKELIEMLSNLDFWITLLEKVQFVGAVVPIMLAFIEAVFPILPMVGIITFNVAVYGAVWGFLYTWIGSCAGCIFMFTIFRKIGKKLLKNKKKNGGRIAKANGWITKLKPEAIFVLLLFPFTPSSVVNTVAGLSDFDSRNYIIELCFAKCGMLGVLAFIGSSILTINEHLGKAVVAIILLIILFLLSKLITEKLSGRSK